MPIEVITALIALGGVILSVIISYLTSQRQIKIEVEKHRAELRKVFGGKLYDRRFEVYPEVYSYLSKFIKVIRCGKINTEAVSELFNQLQEWDSKNSIVFSAYTGHVCASIRYLLAELIKKSDKELQKEYESRESQTKLVRKIQEMVLALKH